MEYSNIDLDNQILKIPSVPNVYFYYLRHGTSSYPLNLEILIHKGDWVQRGDKIAKFADIAVLSPMSGKIIAIGRSDFEHWDEKSLWPIYHSKKKYTDLNDEFNNGIIAAIQPIKGYMDSTGILFAYSEINNFIQKILDKPQKYGRPELDMKEIREAVIKEMGWVTEAANSGVGIEKII